MTYVIPNLRLDGWRTSKGKANVGSKRHIADLKQQYKFEVAQASITQDDNGCPLNFIHFINIKTYQGYKKEFVKRYSIVSDSLALYIVERLRKREYDAASKKARRNTATSEYEFKGSVIKAMHSNATRYTKGAFDRLAEMVETSNNTNKFLSNAFRDNDLFGNAKRLAAIIELGLESGNAHIIENSEGRQQGTFFFSKETYIKGLKNAVSIALDDSGLLPSGGETILAGRLLDVFVDIGAWTSSVEQHGLDLWDVEIDFDTNHIMTRTVCKVSESKSLTRIGIADHFTATREKDIHNATPAERIKTIQWLNDFVLDGSGKPVKRKKADFWVDKQYTGRAQETAVGSESEAYAMLAAMEQADEDGIRERLIASLNLHGSHAGIDAALEVEHIIRQREWVVYSAKLAIESKERDAYNMAQFGYDKYKYNDARKAGVTLFHESKTRGVDSTISRDEMVLHGWTDYDREADFGDWVKRGRPGVCDANYKDYEAMHIKSMTYQNELMASFKARDERSKWEDEFLVIFTEHRRAKGFTEEDDRIMNSERFQEGVKARAEAKRLREESMPKVIAPSYVPPYGDDDDDDEDGEDWFESYDPTGADLF